MDTVEKDPTSVVIDKPTYIVAELSGGAAAWVQKVREAFEPAIAHMPQEITLAGSSGVGPIALGQALTDVSHKLERVVAGKTHMLFRFLGIGRFENTDIFYAQPEQEIFDELHTAIKTSGIVFENSPNPYTPHCSLKGFTPLQPEQRGQLEALTVPSGIFGIESIAIYEMDAMQPHRLFAITFP